MDALLTAMKHADWMERALKESGNEWVRVELTERIGHFCELTGQGYRFDRVAGIAGQWFGQTLH
jgi:hypothetical protein